MYRSGKFCLAMIVVGMKHCEAEYTCLNEDSIFNKAVRSVLIIAGKLCYGTL